MKNITLLLILFISLSMTACGGGGKGDGSNLGSTPLTGEVTPVVPPEELPAIPPVSVVDSILVNWAIPTTRIDSTAIALSEIAGFKIYTSTNNQSIPATPTVIITDGSVTSHNITNLTPGTYYIYVTTYDVNGDESPYSDPISKTI